MTSLLVDVIHLQTWIPAIVQSFAAGLYSQQQQLYILMTADLPPLTTDVAVLEQVLLKLLTHACTFTPAGELISVSADATNNTMQISVSSSDIASDIEISGLEPSQSLDARYGIPENASWRRSSTELSVIQKLAQQLGASILLERAASQTTFILQFPYETSVSDGINNEAGERIILSSGVSTRSIA